MHGGTINVEVKHPREWPTPVERVQFFLDYLERLGYATGTSRAYTNCVKHFEKWLATDVCSGEVPSDGTVRRFEREHLERCRCQGPVQRHRITIHAALRRYLTMLGERGLLVCSPSSVGIPVDAEVSAFETYLFRDCSAAENTMIYRLRYVREFLLMVFGSGPVNRHRVSPKDLMTFVAEHSTTCLPGTVRLIASCLRSYTRFLALQGICGPELTNSVPPIPCWRLSSIPGFLTDKELDALLAVFDRSTATGRRDYAMALCMAELALRTGEVASLNLESINWRQGTLAVRGTKSGRDRILPLCQSTGEAITAYLTEGGRPASTSRALFLRHRAPVGVRVTNGVVRGAIRRACASAEIVPPRAGPHALRHTAATRMVNRGAALSDVADILGHASIETTRIYAKVDLVTLSRVALPWPGGVS